MEKPHSRVGLLAVLGVGGAGLSSAPMAPAKPLVGAHVEPKRPLDTAADLGAGCVQIFLSDPQGWKKPPPRPDADELRDSDVPVYVHAPYLINVCSPKSNVRYGSRKVLQQTCDAAGEVGAVAVIVHPGHAKRGDSARRSKPPGKLTTKNNCNP